MNYMYSISPKCTQSRRTAVRMVLGFTVVETVVAMSILLIVLSIAAPSFRNLILSQRVKNASFDVYSTITLARNEAILKNGTVTIVPTGGSWANGWTVTDASGTVVRMQSATPNIAIAGPAAVSYNSTGRLITTVAPFSLMVNPMLGSSARCISIDLSGRPVLRNANCS